MADSDPQKDGSITASFNFDKRTMEALDRLKGAMGASSRAEVVRRALAFLDVAIDGADGKPVQIETKTGPLRISI